MRRLLEPSAAGGAAANLTEKQEVALNRAYRKACKAYDKNDTVAMIEANIEFRDVWLDAVQNARLQSMIRRFADHAQQVRLSTLKDRSTQKIVVEGMQVLLDGFTKRDSKKIKAAMLGFIVNAEEQYFALLNGQD
jgi:DNA-binding GntR family transcriptional regulator